MSERILVPTDLSENSLPAIELAITLAKPLGAQLDLLHVVDVASLSEVPLPDRASADRDRGAMAAQAREALNTLAERQGEGVVVQCHTRMGTPWEEIAEGARILNAGLLVLSTHGRTGLSHFLVGSVAERVLRAAHCPVLTIRTSGSVDERERALDRASRPPRHILVATDLSQGSLSALRLAGEWAARFDTAISIVHVVDMSYSSRALLRSEHDQENIQQRLSLRAGQALRSFLDDHASFLSPRVLEAPLTLLLGEAAREILLAAQESGTDLIVMGRHGYTGFKRFLMGSVAEDVVRTAEIPVLTLPMGDVPGKA